MESVFRGAAIYAIVWLIFRLAGRRTFAEMTSFDFVLLLIVGEATQQALLGNDFSITNAALIVLTLVGIDVFLSELKQWSPATEKIIDGLPLILLVDGKPLTNRMKRVRVDEEDILDEARKRRGLTHIEQIKYAVLERGGGISIIPRDELSGARS